LSRFLEKEKPRIKLIYRNSKQPTFVEKIKNDRIVADKYNTAELKFQTVMRNQIVKNFQKIDGRYLRL